MDINSKIVDRFVKWKVFKPKLPCTNLLTILALQGKSKFNFIFILKIYQQIWLMSKFNFIFILQIYQQIWLMGFKVEFSFILPYNKFLTIQALLNGHYKALHSIVGLHLRNETFALKMCTLDGYFWTWNFLHPPCLDVWLASWLVCLSAMLLSVLFITIIVV